MVGGEYINLGAYKTAIEAARTYDKAALYFCCPNLKTNGLEKEPFDEREISKLILGED